ncbi:MAG: hypothetical protein IJ772_03960 [Bacilli bacterium]|nr:hypothetical protein [Bacilli bacterium]
MEKSRMTAVCLAIIEIYFEKNCFSKEALLEKGINVTSKEYEECLQTIQEVIQLSPEPKGQGRHFSVNKVEK